MFTTIWQLMNVSISLRTWMNGIWMDGWQVCWWPEEIDDSWLYLLQCIDWCLAFWSLLLYWFHFQHLLFLLHLLRLEAIWLIVFTVWLVSTLDLVMSVNILMWYFSLSLCGSIYLIMFLWYMLSKSFKCHWDLIICLLYISVDCLQERKFNFGDGGKCRSIGSHQFWIHDTIFGWWGHETRLEHLWHRCIGCSHCWICNLSNQRRTKASHHHQTKPQWRDTLVDRRRENLFRIDIVRLLVYIFMIW